MTTTSSTGTAAHGNTPASQAQGSHASTRGHGRTTTGTPGSTDLFANLLLLLNAGSDLTADALAPAAAPAQDTGTQVGPEDATALALDSPQNPLAGLLGWPGAPLPLMPASAAAATDPNSTARLPVVGDAATTSPSGPGAPTASTQRADGLTPTAAAETLDPDTLADLARATAPAESTATDALHGMAPVRITAWRSTTGLVPHTAGLSAAQAVSGASAAHASVSQATFSQATVARMGGADAASALAPQMRSTVQLDERFAQVSADDEPTGPSAMGGTDGPGGAHSEALPGASSATGSAGPDGGAGQDTSADLSQGHIPGGDEPSASDAAAQAAADADDSASGGWGAQHLRHASVRLGEPGEQAIDIQLSMAGQEVRVEFRTDDAQTRDSLAQDGGATLGELLQRSGIDLGGVSVGAQGQQHSEPDHTRKNSPSPSRPTERNPKDPEIAIVAAPQAAPGTRADGSQPLDLMV